MKVIEHIRTIQGEGRKAGEVCDLIRVAGCILRCSFCDTKQAWNENPDLYRYIIEKEEDAIKFVEQIKPKSSVIITGGEPLRYDILEEMIMLYKHLRKNGCNITFETTGLIESSRVKHPNTICNNLGFLNSRFPDALYSISPKLDPSFYNLKHSQLTTNDIVSFYSIHPCDLKLIDIDFYYKYVYKDEDRDIIDVMLQKDIETYIMPWTPTEKQWDKDLYIESCKKTVEYCIEKNNQGFNVKYSPRIQVDIFGIEKNH